MRKYHSDVWRSRSSGWLISLVFHGGVVALAMQAMMDMKPHLQPETFQWDVALHKAPVQSPVAPEVLSPQESIPPPAAPERSSQSVQRPSKTPLQRAVERTAVVQTVQPVQAAPRVIERAATHERQTVVTAVQTMAQPSIQQAVVAQVHEAVSQEVHEAVQSRDEPIVTTQSSAAVIPEAGPIMEAQAAEVEQPAIVEQAVIRSEERIATAAIAPAIEGNGAIEREPTVVHRETVEHRKVREVAQAQADFGWLSESLWKRIEQLKRYPLQARARRWEGKVVLEAVIRHDGTILDCLVAESSGHGLLDQDAMAVLRKASPLALKHPLGKEQITILVPIAYRLGS